MATLDFKLALFGQIYDNEGLLYSYPEKTQQLRMSGQYPAWVNALPIDSRFLRELVTSGGECFSIRYGKEGLFYLYTRYNPHDSRNGAVSVALYAQNYAASDANQLIVALRNLMDYFLEKQSPIGILDTDIAELTKNLSNPYFIKPPTQQREILHNDVYRVYQSEEDLMRYLSWAIQKEYTEYKWVHFISAGHKKAIINPALYTELTTRVVDCYAIKHSDANYELALSGSVYKLNYTKEGYLPQVANIVIGQTSKFTEESNHIIRFKATNEIDLKFKKRITILLYDAATNAPIVENGMQVSTIVEIEEGKTRNVPVSAHGYASKMVLVDPSKQNTAEGTIRQTLQRIAPVGVPRRNDVYDSNTNTSGDDFLRVRIKPFIITTLALALITLIIGGIGGFYIEKHFFPPKEDTTRIDSLMQELEKLSTRNNELVSEKENFINEKGNLLSKIDSLKSEISILTQATQKDKNKKETAAIAAIKYLQTKDTWCLQGIKDYANTDAYNWLKFIVEGDKLNDDRLKQIISKEDVKKNKDWAKIVEIIKSKREQNIPIEKFQKAFKNANSNWDSKNGCLIKDKKNGEEKKLSDGTITLTSLKANILIL